MKTILTLLSFMIACSICVASDYISDNDYSVSYEVSVDIEKQDVSTYVYEAPAKVIYSFSYISSSGHNPESLKFVSIVYNDLNHDSSPDEIPDIGKQELNYEVQLSNYTYKPITFRQSSLYASNLHNLIFNVGSNSWVIC